MEIPSLEQLCDEAQCIILRNQIKLKHPLATLPCAVQHLAEANNEYRLIPSPNGIALSWSSGSAVAKRLLERLKDRINQRLCMTGRQAPRSHIR